MVKLGYLTKIKSLNTFLVISDVDDVIMTCYENFVKIEISLKNSFRDMKSTKLRSLNTIMLLTKCYYVIITNYKNRKMSEIIQSRCQIRLFDKFYWSKDKLLVFEHRNDFEGAIFSELSALPPL